MLAKMIADMIMLPARIPFEQSETEDCAAGFSAAFEDYHNTWNRNTFEIPSDDIIINGEYIINPVSVEGRKKVAVICHGQTVTRAGAIKYAKIFYDKGYNLVLFDERYFGKTTGDYCTLGWKENRDIKNILSYTKEIFGKDCFVAVHGESMGAGSSLLMLDSEKPDYVVADCPFCDVGLLISDLAKERAWIFGKIGVRGAVRLGIKRCGLDFRKVRPINSVEMTEVPICFMHGKEDSLINPKHSQMMFDKCKNELSEIHLFDNTDHARSIFNYPEEYSKIMCAFIDKMEKYYGIK